MNAGNCAWPYSSRDSNPQTGESNQHFLFGDLWTVGDFDLIDDAAEPPKLVQHCVGATAAYADNKLRSFAI